MKKRIYIKISSKRVHASFKKNFSPLNNGNRFGLKYYPTAVIALDLDIDDKVFEPIEVKLNEKITRVTEALDIKEIKEDNQ